MTLIAGPVSSGSIGFESRRHVQGDVRVPGFRNAHESSVGLEPSDAGSITAFANASKASFVAQLARIYSSAPKPREVHASRVPSSLKNESAVQILFPNHGWSFSRNVPGTATIVKVTNGPPPSGTSPTPVAMLVELGHKAVRPTWM